ncbi:MAG: hypothetical protein HZA70_05010 [Planctomycetes bacterium]|nr:hypothetical protein [Planctomycetota bacterium]
MARNHEVRASALAQLESGPKGQANAEAPGIVRMPPSHPTERNEELPVDLTREETVALAGTINSVARKGQVP